MFKTLITAAFAIFAALACIGASADDQPLQQAVQEQAARA